MDKENLYRGCPVQYTLSYLGGKWQIGILWSLKEKPLRFGVIKKRLANITEKMLMQELRFFEQQGMVERKVFTEIPPKVEYRLTAKGQTLMPIISSILEWGYANLQNEKVSKEMFMTPANIMEEIDESLSSKEM
jgi:DNA-binding HxlR family transcriptional regulator